MKMRSLSRFFMSMLAMCTIAACSNDELGNDPIVDPDASQDAVYMNVQVQLPVAGGSTRSKTNTPDDGDYGTSTDGTEVGKDYENAVNRILLVLADQNNNLIGCGKQEGFNTQTGDKVNTVQSIKKSTLKAYYEANVDESKKLTDNTIHVYIFCNPTTRLSTFLTDADLIGKDEWVNYRAILSESPTDKFDSSIDQDGAAIWGGTDHKNGFLMSTAVKSDIKKQIPTSMNDWNNYNSKDKAFDLTGTNEGTDKIDNGDAIQVERSVARFDFKDGSPEGTDPNTYNVVKNDQDQYTIQVRLERMGLVNMSKEFYYLRRVSDDGYLNNSTLCGTERNTNYVVDTDVDFKKGTLNADSEYEKHFNFCLGNVDKKNNWSINKEARNQWYNKDIKEVLQSGEDDNYGTTPSYKIWRYVTENTIPSNDNLQRNGISTGIVFKGKIISTSNTDPELKQVLDHPTGISDKDPILYKYNNQLYVRWTEVRKVALLNREKMPDFYRLVFGDADYTTIQLKDDAKGQKAIYSTDEKSPDYLWGRWQDNDNEPQDENGLVDSYRLKFKEAATKRNKQNEVGFTLYQSSEDEEGNPGYFCYYYYWNRHNNNGNNGEMGPMEFAVVRNNVYKLAVTSINELGHPRVSENDPDPKDPEDPDEKDEVYFKLAVEVLPWVVRVNNIEF